MPPHCPYRTTDTTKGSILSKIVDPELEPCARQYADVMAKLAEGGYRTTFTQTGGMCPAIELHVDEARFALVTDADGRLAWDRVDHRVGLSASMNSRTRLMRS